MRVLTGNRSVMDELQRERSYFWVLIHKSEFLKAENRAEPLVQLLLQIRQSYLAHAII